MRNFLALIGVSFLIFACKPSQVATSITQHSKSDFVVAFGSCNKQWEPNKFWDDIEAQQPNVWIWGGDNIYASVDFDLKDLKKGYKKQNKDRAYKSFKSQVPTIGTWDDHDYGLNDGGSEFSLKKESQQLFLDFMGVPSKSVRRSREGVYTAHEYATSKGKVKVLVLDTRYFRSALEKNPDPNWRYKIQNDKNATVLGESQWQWLQAELTASEADFNLVISSIQFLSGEHGFETWANFPNELKKLEKLIVNSKAKGVIILSGDRHISEFSKTTWDGMTYPTIDFTSSGLTHSYSSFDGEPNRYRIGEVVSVPSFGVIELNFEKKEAHFKIMGENGMVYQELKQAY